MYTTDFETLAAEHRDLVLPAGTEKTRVMTDFHRHVERVGQRVMGGFVSYEEYLQRSAQAARNILGLIVATPLTGSKAESTNPSNTVKISVLANDEQPFGILELATFDRLLQSEDSCQVAAFWESDWSDFNVSSVVRPVTGGEGYELYRANHDLFIGELLGVEEAITTVYEQVEQRGSAILSH